MRHHVAAGVQFDEGEVAAALDLANLVARAAELKVAELLISVVFLAGPLERLGPRLVAEPIADEIGVALLHVSKF